MRYSEKWPRLANVYKAKQEEINQAIIDADIEERKTSAKNFEEDFYKVTAQAEKEPPH